MPRRSAARTLTPLEPLFDKADGVRWLAAKARLGAVESENHLVGHTIEALLAALGPLTNRDLTFRPGITLPGATERLLVGAREREIAPPLHLGALPPGFTRDSRGQESPELRALEVPEALLCNLGNGPVVVGEGGTAVAADVSSRFAGLAQFYAIDLRRAAAEAPRVEGTLLSLGDDVWPLNFCHWLVDWLPRLAFLGGRRRDADLRVATPVLTAPYQWETLRLCGIPRERVVQIPTGEAVRARRVLALSDVPNPPHPGHGTAPWLLNFLRGALGWSAFAEGMAAVPQRRKIYVSRRDTAGRRVLNEAGLIAALAPLGYAPVALGGLGFAAQIALFAGASHVVAPHGAGLANIVFADPATTLLEIFPSSFGMPTYYVLTAGLGATYASYVADRIAPGIRAQLDDFSVDVGDFLARCRHVL